MPQDMNNKKQAHLHWSSTNHQQPCFCNETIHLNIEKLKATPETIGSIFGVKDLKALSLQDQNGSSLKLDTKSQTWPVEADHEYQVIVDNKDTVVVINQIFEHVFDSDEDKIHALSNAFYDRVWNHPDTPTEFRNKFHSLTSTATIQAYRQFNWFCEVFGGPSLVGSAEQRDQNLLPRVMAKHTSSRMSKQYAIDWLHLMNATLDEQFPTDTKRVKEILGLYWLHFYAFFPYMEEERAEFRNIALGDNK